MQTLSGLSLGEVKHILNCTAWRRAREGWREEARVCMSKVRSDGEIDGS